MKSYISGLMLVPLFACHPVHASENSTPCDYEHKVQSSYIYTIENTKNFKREVFPYIDDTRKCVITMWVQIKDKTYPAQGDYVFGPDVSENVACDFAEKKAKEQVIREVSPVTLTANTDMTCVQDSVQGNSVNGSTTVSKTVSGSSTLSSPANVGDEIVVSRIIRPIKPSWSPDPSVQYYGNYDERPFTLTGLFSLVFGGM